MNPRLKNHAPRATRRSAAFRSSSAKLASALLLLSGLTSSLFAQATCVGDTSQDWNLAANWSSDPANPSGNFTVNTATGNFPVLAAASAFSPVDILIGVGTGLNGRLDVNGGSVSTGPGNWLIMGRNGGTGTLNVTNGTVNTQDLRLGSTENTGTATVNVNAGGVVNAAGIIAMAAGNGADDTIVGTLNVNAGGTANCEFDMHLAFAGNASTVGTLNIADGGVVNVGTGTKRWLIMSEWDATRGVINVNGGTLNLNAGTDIQFSIGGWGPGASNGASAITLNSGAINMTAGSVINLNNNADRAVNHNINLNGGTFTIGSIVSGKPTGTRAVNFNGGVLRAAASSATFIGANAVSALNVLSGGATLDSNGFDITVARGLTADTVSTGGGLTKLGAGTLTLGGINTYAGNTTVSDGTLALADNASIKFVVGANGVNSKLTGTGAVTLDGDLEFDLTNAVPTVGNTWQVVDIATLNETYGSTFSVNSFALSSGKWIKPAVGTTVYQFDPATGVLSAITDPSITFPPPTVTPGAASTSYPIGSDFTLRVTASGTGNLTYQWYYQATAGATPQPISGATNATYTVAGATAGSGGIYSVIVSDDANGSTPTTASFPAISVLPGSAFSVAYYRFEEGPDTEFITGTNDSVGVNHLVPVVGGTPNYASDSLPYAKIPRTGATNTLGANFPATGNNGNHGLVAPTNTDLATSEFSDFTVEAFVRLDSLAGWQTIVGRDDSGNPGQAAGPAALFYLSKAGAAVGSGVNNGFRIELTSRSGANVQVNSTFVPAVGTWYHVAAVGDAAKGTLTLYVNGVSVGSTPGYDGLFVPTPGSDAPWTLGRGDYNAGDVDFLRGDLDEVRFSRAALPPTQFLAATDSGFVIPPVISRAPINQTLRTGQSTTLSVTATGGTLTYEWYKNDVLISGQNTNSLVLDNVTAASEGTYRVKVIDSASATLGVDISTTATAVVRVLSVNTSARAIGLNFVGAGSGNWSDVLSILAPDYTAGFHPAANWNNSASVTGVTTQTTPLALTESTGSSGYTTATWNSVGTWAGRIELGTPEQKSEHGRLIHGYIESRASTGATVNLSNIPYGTYDVLVYVAGGTSSAPVGSITLDSPGAPTYYYRVLQNDTSRPIATPTVEAPYAPLPMIGDALDATAAAAAAPATFVRFTGVSGSDLVITAKDAVLNANAGGIAAVQIVDTTPAGAAYPPTVTASPVSLLKAGGATATLSVSALSNNPGGVLSYQWQKDGSPLSGQTASTLVLNNVTGAQTGSYSVVVTDTSSLGVSSTTRTASLVVVDSTRPLLINGDVGTATSPTYTGEGILRANGSLDHLNLEPSATVWNGIAGAVGSATRALAKDAAGLALPGVTFTYTGAAGAEDDITLGNINNTGAEPTPAMPLERDYLFANAGTTTPLTGTVGGLQALAGKQVTLLVYAIGKTTKTGDGIISAAVNDTATVTLASGNNHLAAPAFTTSVFGFGGNDDSGRNIEYNTPLYVNNTLPASAYAAFTGVVAADGTVSWSMLPDTSVNGGGLVPLVGFQLFVSGTDIAPPVPAGLAAVAGNNQVALSWSAASGAQTYTVKRADSLAGTYATISAGLITGTSYTDTTAVNGSTYYYVVASANSLAQSSDSTPVSVTLGAGTTAVQSWRQTYFGVTTNTGNAANAADPDADGQTNLLEYALGTDPTASNASAALIGRSGSVLTLGFTPTVDPALSYIVEASSDLSGGFTTAQNYGAFATSAPVTYTDSVTLAPGVRRFLRLHVELAE